MTDRRERVVHIRFEGQSWSVAFSILGISNVRGDGCGDSRGHCRDDEAVRQAVAGYLEVQPQQLAPYVVQRHANGNVTVRPQAVFG
jgi:hypothetical protein